MKSPFECQTFLPCDMWEYQPDATKTSRHHLIRFVEHAIYKVPLLLEKHTSMNLATQKALAYPKQKSVSYLSKEAGVLIHTVPIKSVRFSPQVMERRMSCDV